MAEHPSEMSYEVDVNMDSVWSVLDTSVLLLTFVYKAPQVIAVLCSRSSDGISMTSLVLEFASYSVEMTYQIAMNYPFRTFIEICLMWAQDIILLYVVLKERNMIHAKVVPPLLLYAFCFTCIIKRWLPDVIMYGLILSTTPVLIVSKSTQFFKVVSTRDPGSLSALTWGILSYLAAARVLTSIFVTGDLAMFLNTGSATILDLAVFGSIVYFNNLKQRRYRNTGRRARN